GTGWTVEKQVRITRAISQVKRISGEGLTTSIGKYQSRIASTFIATIDRQQVGQVLGIHQPVTATDLIQSVVISHGDMSQIGIQSVHIVIATNQLQATGAE